MHVSPFIVNWDKLLEFQDADEFSCWAMELDEYPTWIRDFELYRDGASLYMEIAVALADEATKSDTKAPLLMALASVVCGDDALKIEDFPCPPDSCYISAISPATVNRLKHAMDSATEDDWNSIYGILAPAGDPVHHKGYLSSVRALIAEAATSQNGILIHMG